MSMSFTWTNENLIRLIELYKNAECLWNPHDSDYKDRFKKHDAWRELSNATGADVYEVKRKTKNISTQFYRERKKYRKLEQSGVRTKFVCKWFAYKYLTFLADKNTGQCSEKGFYDKESDNSINDDEEYEANEECEDVVQSEAIAEVEQETQDGVLPEAEYVDEANQDPLSQEQETHDAGIQRSRRNRNGGSKRRKQRRSKQYSQEQEADIQEEAYLFLKELRRKQHFRDDFSVFGEHVACKIRNLKTEFARNTVEHMISNILWEASTGKYDHP